MKYAIEIFSHEAEGTALLLVVVRFWGTNGRAPGVWSAPSIAIAPGESKRQSFKVPLALVERIEVLAGNERPLSVTVLPLDERRREEKPPAPPPTTKADVAAVRAVLMSAPAMPIQTVADDPPPAPRPAPAGDGRCTAERGLPGGLLVRCRLKKGHEEQHAFPSGSSASKSNGGA